MTGQEIEKEDENIYNKEDRKEQLEKDEIEPAEAAFMEGYEDTKLVNCNSCGKQLDYEKSVSREINGTNYTFCSQECADKFEKENQA